MQNAPNDKRSLYIGEHIERHPLSGCAIREPTSFPRAGGLEESVTEDIVRAAFQPFGELTDVNLPLDATSRARLVRSRLRPTATSF